MARICMVAQSYYLRDPRVRREAEALAEARHEVDVICLKDESEKPHEIVNRVTVHRLPLRRRRGGFLRYIFEYSSFLVLSSIYLSYLHIKHHYHIIHVHNMPDFLVFCSIIPRLLGAKVLLDVHDPMPELFSSEFRLGQDHRLPKLLRFQERLSYWYPYLLLTVNQSMRQRIIAKGVSPARVVTLLNSPDLKLFPCASDRSAEKRDAFTLVYTGTIAQRYGLDVAVKGIKLLTKDMSDIHLLIIGEGRYLNDLKRLVNKLSLHQYVIFKGKAPLEEIPKILAKCDVGISPHRNDSFWKLYFSTKILEFLAMGLPVISSRTRTIEYYLDDSIFYFEPEDVNGFAEQVHLIRQNPQLVTDKMKKAEEKLRELSWDHEKEKLQKLVAELAPVKNR